METTTHARGALPPVSGLAPTATMVPTASMQHSPVRYPAAVLCLLGATAVAAAQARTPCDAVPLAVATQLLGPGARLASDDANVCEYNAAHGTGAVRSLRLSVSSPGSAGAAKALFAQVRQQQEGRNEPGLGDAAFSVVDATVNCAGITALKGARFYEVGLCGPGFGTAADVPRLRALALQLLSGI